MALSLAQATLLIGQTVKWGNQYLFRIDRVGLQYVRGFMLNGPQAGQEFGDMNPRDLDAIPGVSIYPAVEEIVEPGGFVAPDPIVPEPFFLEPDAPFIGPVLVVAEPEPLPVFLEPEPETVVFIPEIFIEPEPEPEPEPVFIPEVEPVVQEGIPVGADLRDFTGSNGVAPPASPAVGVIMLSRLLPLVPVAGRAGVLGWAAGRIGTTIGWSSLPGWLRTVLSVAGFTGFALLVDGVTDVEQLPNLPGFGGGTTSHVQHGAAVVGSWVANGVTFYRLADGKLAVQNKKGRWKVWRPKKPIVLYSSGAINVKTLIKADKVLAKQAKAIASMLNRRAPRRKTPKKEQAVQVVAHSVPVGQLTSGR